VRNINNLYIYNLLKHFHFAKNVLITSASAIGGKIKPYTVLSLRDHCFSEAIYEHVRSIP